MLVCVSLPVVKVVSGLDTEVEWSIGGLRRAHTQSPDQNGIKTGLVVDPRSMSLVTNSTPGFIQFYDPVSDSVKQEVRQCFNILNCYNFCSVHHMQIIFIYSESQQKTL